MKIYTDYFYIRRILLLMFVLLEFGAAGVSRYSWHEYQNYEMSPRILAKVMLGPFVLVGHDADALIMVESTMIPVVALWLWPLIVGIVMWLLLPRADRYNRIVLERQTRETIWIPVLIGSVTGTISGGCAASMDPGFDRNATGQIFSAWPTLQTSMVTGAVVMSLLIYIWKRNAPGGGEGRTILASEMRVTGAAFVCFFALWPGLIQGLPAGCTILVGTLLGICAPFVLLGLALVILAAIRLLFPPQYEKKIS